MALSKIAVSTAALLLLPAVRAITPEQLVSAHRRSPASANPSGEWAVFTSTNYSLASHSSATTWNLMNVNTGGIATLPFSDEVSEIAWVGSTPTSVLYINGTNDDVPGGVTLWTADLGKTPFQGQKVASLNAPFSGLKAVLTKSGNINFVVNSLAYANNGSAYNAELVPKSYTTGRLYDNVFVRHWDTYIQQERYAVFGGSLVRSNLSGSGYGSSGGSSSYTLKGDLKNLLRGINASVTRPETPVQPFGDEGDYDLSPDGSQVAFLTKAPQLPKANYTASYIYVAPIDGSSVAKRLNGPGSSAPKAAQGASGAPRWSPDGKSVVYFQQDGVSYESDRSKLYVADISSGKISSLVPSWDVSPISMKWTADGQSLYVSADYIGSTRLFVIPAHASSDYQPKNITDITSVTDFYVLPKGGALVTASAVWSPFNVYIVNSNATTKYLFKANEHDPEFAGLGPEDVGHFWYEGTLGDKQQAIVVYPENFDPKKVYDLVFYVHGGPQGYTGNVWSNRWNLKTWADQGYVLIGPNPTGSTSYGQNLTDRIQGRWGSWPYEDLVKAHTYACSNLKYINCSNAVEAGASYGGYMTNWIQGHDLGRQFKALVSHDGIATTWADYGTEELWFIQHDFNGTVWQDPGRSNYAAWDPLTHAKNFSTPQFVIHSDGDYRLPVSEGITMFNALQELGVPSRFLNFPDETHWVLHRENSLFWHHEIYNWINYWTGKIPSLDKNAITQ